MLTAAAAVLPAIGGANPASATSTTLKVFKAHGTFAWTVPTGVTRVTFVVYGASGGDVLQTIQTPQGPILSVVSSGGAGGEAVGSFAVTSGETFEIVVGGEGGYSIDTYVGGDGGFNGGGVGGDNYTSLGAPGGPGGGGGGGGSDVRIGGRGNPCASTKACGVVDRIIAAGGGGAAEATVPMAPSGAASPAGMPTAPTASARRRREASPSRGPASTTAVTYRSVRSARELMPLTTTRPAVVAAAEAGSVAAAAPPAEAVAAVASSAAFRSVGHSRAGRAAVTERSSSRRPSGPAVGELSRVAGRHTPPLTRTEARPRLPRNGRFA